MEAGEEGWGGDAVCFGWSEERVGCLWVLQRGEDGGGPGGVGVIGRAGSGASGVGGWSMWSLSPV